MASHRWTTPFGASSEAVERDGVGHFRCIRPRRVMAIATTHQTARTSTSRLVASKTSEARPARSRSAPAWIGRYSCRVWNHCGSWSAGNVMGEKGITKEDQHLRAQLGDHWLHAHPNRIADGGGHHGHQQCAGDQQRPADGQVETVPQLSHQHADPSIQTVPWLLTWSVCPCRGCSLPHTIRV